MGKGKNIKNASQGQAQGAPGNTAGGGGVGGGPCSSAPDPSLAVVALHPQGDAIAVALGSCLRVFDCRTRAMVAAMEHTAAVRDLKFQPGGRLLLAGGDDKCSRAWDTATWRLLQTWEAPKKISAVAFSGDGRFALFADKFGDVLVAASPDPDPASNSTAPAGSAPGDQGGAAPFAATATWPQAQNGTAAPPSAAASEQDRLPQAQNGTSASPSAAASEQGGAQAAAAAAAPAPGGVGAMAAAGTTKPALLLGHFCSTITAVAVAPAGRLLASADRDGKVRVSILPRQPLLGAPEIQAFCLGHTAFASCTAFTSGPGGLRLLSGSGDGTVRLWDPETGRLLATLAASMSPAAPAPEQPDAPPACEGGGAPHKDAGRGPKAAQELPEARSSSAGAAAAGAQAAKEGLGSALEAEGGGAEPTADLPTAGDPAAAQMGDGLEEGDGGGDGAALEVESAEEPDQALGGPFRGYTREQLPPAVLCVAASQDGLVAAAAVEGRAELLLLAVDGEAGTLALAQELALPGLARPTAAAFGHDGRLWVVGGVAAEGAGTGALHLRVAAPDGHGGYAAEGAGDGLAAAAQELLEAAFAGGSAEPDAAMLQLNTQLKKRMFLAEDVATRKRVRAVPAGGSMAE